MKGDPELEPVRASNFSPGSDDVLSRSDIHGIPRLVLRVPAVKIVMMIGKRDEILGSGLGIEPNQLLGIPLVRPPEVANVFVPEL